MTKLIHRIWMGNPMPEIFVEFGEQWAEMNPDYEVKLWTEEEIWDTEWHNQAVLDQMEKESLMPNADMVAYWTHVADVIDYEIIYKQGGWVLNTDIKPIRPLSHLETMYDMSRPGVAMEDDVWPVNAAMYATQPGEPFFGKVIENLGPRYFDFPGAYMNFTTGPHLLQTTIASTRSRPRLNRYHRNVFNPIHWSQFDSGKLPEYDRDDYPPETVGTHIWGSKTNQRGQRIIEDWPAGDPHVRRRRR